MTTPTPDADNGSLEARHYRAIFGGFLCVVATFMAGWAVFHPSAAPSVLELVHEIGFPVLLLLAGLALTSSQAVRDIAGALRGFLPGSKSP